MMKMRRNNIDMIISNEYSMKENEEMPIFYY